MAIDASKQRQLRRASQDVLMSLDPSSSNSRGSSGIRTDDVTLQTSVASDWLLLARENSNLVTVLLRILKFYC